MAFCPCLDVHANPRLVHILVPTWTVPVAVNNVGLPVHQNVGDVNAPVHPALCAYDTWCWTHTGEEKDPRPSTDQTDESTAETPEDFLMSLVGSCLDDEGEECKKEEKELKDAVEGLAYKAPLMWSGKPAIKVVNPDHMRLDDGYDPDFVWSW